MITEYPEGATPLDADERRDLIPPDIMTQAELNCVEQGNIVSAQNWVFKKKRKDVLSENFLRRLHREMFKLVWRWAGQYRQSEKNIGVTPCQIPIELHNLVADCEYWIKNQTYGWDEIGVRFHHRLVSVHPFSNGNGRHARLATDVLLMTHDQKIFSWGNAREELVTNNLIREKYITALKAADQRDCRLLMEFVRS